MTPDQINCCFELGAAIFLSLNVRRLYCDKKVRGACIPPVFFMAVWGVYGLYFYPSIGAWWSFGGCVPIACVNIIYTSQMFYYRKKRWHNYTFSYSEADKEAAYRKASEVFKKYKFQPPSPLKRESNDRNARSP